MSHATMPMTRAPSTKSLRQLLDGVCDVDAPDARIADITLDSRTATPGAMFIALPGARTHGLSHAEQAVANGATVIAYEPDADSPAPTLGNALLLPVPGLSAMVGDIADRFFDAPSASVRVLGVTGTNGKTTSAFLLPAALGELGQRAGYAGTLGYGHVDALRVSGFTTADCVTVHRQLAAMRDAGDQAVGMEVSSHALDQGRIDGVRVHSALFTNLTRDHLDYHGTIAAYGAAKERLFRRAELQHAVINVGDAFGRDMTARLRQANTHARITAYASTAAHRNLGDCVLFANKVELRSSGVVVSFDGSFGGGVLRSRLIGAFNAENLLGVLGVLLGLDVPLDQAVAALEECAAPPGRMETHAAPGKPLVVIDYAHSPDALEKALSAARAHARGRLACVFGCGGDRDAGKRPLMGAIAEQLADAVILTDDNPRMEDGDAVVADILQGFDHPDTAIIERDRAKAIARAIAMCGAGDVVLIAGKGHEDYQIVGRNVKKFSDREAALKCLRADA